MSSEVVIDTLSIIICILFILQVFIIYKLSRLSNKIYKLAVVEYKRFQALRKQINGINNVSPQFKKKIIGEIVNQLRGELKK